MHPIAVQVKAIAVGGIEPYPERVNKERISLNLGRFWAIDPADTHRTNGARRQC